MNELSVNDLSVHDLSAHDLPATTGRGQPTHRAAMRRPTRSARGATVALAVVTVVALAWCGAAGCQAGNQRKPGDVGSGGVGAGDAGGGLPLAADASSDRLATDQLPPPACAEVPRPRRATGGTLALSIAPLLDGKPMIFGEPNPLRAGGTLMPLNFRFYVSDVALLSAAGQTVPVDLVTTAGTPEPYDVHLFNAEDPASEVLRLLAPPGTYRGLSFVLGLDDACNGGSAMDRKPPLTETSQMVWPHAVGYLFLRFEDQVVAGSGAADGGSSSIPPAIHMGGVPGVLLAPIVKVTGTFSIGASAVTAKSLNVDLDALFAGATADVDPATLTGLFPGVEVEAGERLRQHVGQLPVFVLAP